MPIVGTNTASSGQSFMARGESAIHKSAAKAAPLRFVYQSIMAWRRVIFRFI